MRSEREACPSQCGQGKAFGFHSMCKDEALKDAKLGSHMV